MPTVAANGIDIYYELHGHGSGQPLVLAHGFTGPTDDWREEVLPLAANRTLLLYDVRGHGRTTAPADPSLYSMATFAADQAALMRAIGIERAHVGGLSMGGMIAAQFALDYPQMVQSLLLCDTTTGNGVDAGPAGQWERFLERGFLMSEHIVRKYGFEELARRQLEWARENDPHFHERPEPPERTYERLRAMTLEGFLGASKAIRERPDLTGRLHAIKAPTLVLVGEWDGFLPCARLAHQRIPGSRFVLVRRSAHGTPAWRPQAFQRAVLEFLEAVEKGRPIPGDYEV